MSKIYSLIRKVEDEAMMKKEGCARSRLKRWSMPRDTAHKSQIFSNGHLLAPKKKLVVFTPCATCFLASQKGHTEQLFRPLRCALQ